MSKPDNYAAFYGLLNRMPCSDRDELKKQIVMSYTFGRTYSLREMTMPEYLSALEGMKRLAVPANREPAQNAIRKKRSAVLHLMQRFGIDTADWMRVDAFCSDARIAGKVFRKLDGDELHALLVKLRAIARKGR
ncbi:hypothetical protein [Viscerimonas tarda]